MKLCDICERNWEICCVALLVLREMKFISFVCPTQNILKFFEYENVYSTDNDQ